MIQYRLTPLGSQALAGGNRLCQIAQEVAEDGVITSKELMSYGLSERESQFLINILLRLNFIDYLPIQGVRTRKRYDYNLN